MSGLVKGVKKVFKAIGSVVKKILKSPIFKAILIAAAVIFTGGAAIAGFGAMGAAGATFGSVMSASLAGGIAPFSAAISAITGAAQSVGSALGIGGTTAVAEGGAMAAAATEAAAAGTAAWAAPAVETAGLFGAGEMVAGGAAVAEGSAGIAASGGVDAMATYAAEAAAPGAASWGSAAGEVAAAAPMDAMAGYAAEASAPGATSWGAAPEPFSLANAAPEAMSGYTPQVAQSPTMNMNTVSQATPEMMQSAQPSMMQPEMVNTAQPNLMQPEMASAQAPMQTMQPPTQMPMSNSSYANSAYTPMDEGFGNAVASSSSGGSSAAAANGGSAATNNWMGSLWNFVKPAVSSKEGQLLIGQTLMGAARGISEGREAQEQRDYRAARSAVPRNSTRYEAIPGHAAWALNGGK